MNEKMNQKTWRRLRLWTVGLALGLAAAPAVLRAQDNPQRGQGQGQGDRPRRNRGGGPGGPGGPGRMSPVQTVERSKEDVMSLDLKDDQKTKLDAIFKDAGEQAKSLETEVASLQGRERAEKLQPFGRDLREKVSGVLTEEQKQALRKKMAGRMATQMTERWQRALGELNLTADQKTKVDALLADAQKKMESQAAEADPGQGQGQGRGPGGGFAAMRETRQKIQDLLTPEQKTKLDELMPPGGRGGQGGRGGRGAGNPPQQ
jgi:Spy/CpxP family protein refolding chaperone